jgi:hypothetical protein
MTQVVETLASIPKTLGSIPSNTHTHTHTHTHTKITTQILPNYCFLAVFVLNSFST